MANTAFTLGTAPTLLAATQAQLETATSVATYSSPGQQQSHPGHPKAWAEYNFASGPTRIVILAAYNVASGTFNGTGDYDIVWDTDFSSTSYCVVGSSGGTGVAAATESSFGTQALSTTDAQIYLARLGDVATDSAFTNPSINSIVAYGDQA